MGAKEGAAMSGAMRQLRISGGDMPTRLSRGPGFFPECRSNRRNSAMETWRGAPAHRPRDAGGATMEVAMKKFVAGLAVSVCAAALVIGGSALAGTDPPAASAISKIQRISVSTAGVQADAACYLPVFSPDGTKVLFQSAATNLTGASNGIRQLYVKTLANGIVRMVSSSAAGVAGDGATYHKPVFSADGTKVLFTSNAGNLVPGDTNGAADVFEKNLTTGAIRRLSTSSTGAQGDFGGSDGRYSPDRKSIVFLSYSTNLIATDTNGYTDVFVKELATGKVRRVSLTWDHKQTNDNSGENVVYSPDGKKIAFNSAASNLVPGDTNGNLDIFIRDLATGAIARVNVNKAGGQSNGWDDAPPVFHPNGKEVVFVGVGTNMIAGDTNGTADIFAKNPTTGTVRRLSLSRSGHQLTGYSTQPAFDASGNVFAFVTTGSDALTIAPPPAAGPMVAPLAEVIVKNAATGKTVRVSTTLAGVKADGSSADPDVSADGKLVAFSSLATNLVAGDTNGVEDVFVVTLK